MDVTKAKESFRRVRRDDYPELGGYSDEDIWRDRQGPGGLCLAARMARQMNLKAGDLVLDLGCGMGESSVFLATRFGVRVVAVDLWTSATMLSRKFSQRGCRADIVPLNLDARQPLPFADEFFDAVFCMNSLSFFGGDTESLSRLVRHLKKKGSFCAGGECMSREFNKEEMASPPDVYSFVEGIWEGDFLKLHSPSWWEELFTASEALTVTVCEELQDGVVLLEEEVMAVPPVGYLGLTADQAREIEIQQLLYGRENEPHMTVFLIAASKE